ncbi:MAG: hypothetical protein ACPG4T_19985 [Nannocystaceae bacterium]
MKRFHYALGFACAVALTSCFFSESRLPPDFAMCEGPAPGNRPSQAPTYFGEVQPLLAANCVTCHQDGGIGPFRLDGYEEAEMWGPTSLAAIENGDMPPWPPSDCCAELRHKRSMTPDEVEVLRAWIDAGSPMGDATQASEPPTLPGLSRVDLEVTMPDAYTPTPSLGPSDDNRCFILDWPLSEKTYVTGLDVVPGQRELLHHAVVYAIDETSAENYRTRDENDPGPGWNCPGGTPSIADAYIGSWVPGSLGQDYPEGLGRAVKPGSKLLLAAHYELSAGSAPDQSTLRFRLEDRVETEVEGLAVMNPLWLFDGAMKIPAGDPDVMHAYAYDPTAWFNLGRPLKVHDVSLHMHEWGTQASLAILRANGDVDCLLQIDAWDFDWQGEYFLQEPAVLHLGDRLYVECHFDNSAENQPNGEAASDLSWGDDLEMCIGSVLISR